MTAPSAQEWVARLGLVPHPEGGYFRETWRSPGSIPGAALPAAHGQDRAFSTAILYLLPAGAFSAFHRLRSDEIWCFHAGADLEVHRLVPTGAHVEARLGIGDAPGLALQAVVPAGDWFAARPAGPGAFSLVSCIVAPGFDFADFELAGRGDLVRAFPQHRAIIEALTRA